MKMNAYTLQRMALDISHLPQYDLKRYQILPTPEDNGGNWMIAYDTTKGHFIWPKELPSLCSDIQRMAAHYKKAGFDVAITEKMMGTPDGTYGSRHYPVMTVQGTGGEGFMTNLRKAYLSALEEGAVVSLGQSLDRAIDGYAAAAQLDSNDRFTGLSREELQTVLQKAVSHIVSGYVTARSQPEEAPRREARQALQPVANSITARL